MINIGDIVDERYHIISELGEGGFAYVFKAEDIITNKIVAIKIIKDEVLRQENSIDRFEREARACASLNHVNIVRILNVQFRGKPKFIVQELIKGKTLKDRLDVSGKLNFREAAEIMYQLCEAVSFAHSYLVIHRDIKPDNVFMTPDEMVKLGDFGIAFFENAHRVTQSQVIIGSVHYLPPEVTNGQSPTFRSDIYSLGITFFELITGKVPFEGNNQITVAMRHIKEKFPSPRQWISSTPRAIERIILKACRKNPVDRYRSVLEFQKEIKECLDNPKMITPKQSFWAKLLGLKVDES
jgi:serine/threonine-protein kinase